MYPFGLIELILALYGSYRLINDSFSKKKIEYIELDETQYQRVQNIITDVDNNTEPSPPYTEIYPNINNENLNLDLDKNINNTEVINEEEEPLINENNNLIENRNIDILNVPFH